MEDNMAPRPKLAEGKVLCPKCGKVGIAFEFVRLKWKTNAGEDRNKLVHGTCYDREIKRRENKILK